MTDREMNNEVKGTAKTEKAIEAELCRINIIRKKKRERERERLEWRKFEKKKEKFKIKGQGAFQNVAKIINLCKQ